MWGKIIGGVAGFAAGGPFGAMVGAALGHAAETGAMNAPLRPPGQGAGGGAHFAAAKVAALRGRRDEVFALCAVVLSARLAKCDGAVNRAEIDAFKRHFRTPPESARDVGRLFDQARDGTEPYEPYAAQLGQTFVDRPGTLETVLAALFAIARADGPITVAEQQFLQSACVQMGLGLAAWERAQRGQPASGSHDAFDQTEQSRPGYEYAGQYRSHQYRYDHQRTGVTSSGDDPYATLGVARSMPDEQLRAAWKRLMRENHPDSLASRGAAPDVIVRAGDRVARINAAWDRIKRERGL